MILYCVENGGGIHWEDFKIGSLDLKKEYMWERVTYHVHVCLELLSLANIEGACEGKVNKKTKTMKDPGRIQHCCHGVS